MVKDECYSGIARLSTALKSLSCDVKIQAGDWVQGSLLDTVFKQDIAIEAYKWINYDFATFGNHEFDYGNTHINDTVRQIAPRTTFLASNVFFSGQGMDDLPLFRYVDRHDICWVSALTKETLDLAAVEDNVSIEDEDSFMVKYINQCAQTKNVIAITHQGYNNDLETCRNVKEIDIIIGGHSHTNLNQGQYPVKVTRDDGSVCFVTQTYAHGRYVGVLDVGFDENGNVLLESHAYVPMDFRVKYDPEVLLKVQLYNYQVAKKAGEVICTATDDVVGGQLCRGPVNLPDDGSYVHSGCSMGHLVCDAMIYVSAAYASDIPRLCFMNGGTLRNSFSKGKVTLRDIVNVLPFGNTIVSMKLKGSAVLDALNHGFSVYGTDNKGAFPGGMSNMVVKAHVDGSKPEGSMVTVESVTIDGKVLEADKEYILLTNSYIAGGGDGYSWPVEGTDWGTMLREATQTYLEKHDPYSPVTEGRLLMRGSNVASVNKASAAAYASDSGDSSLAFMDEAVDVETELDETLVTPPKVRRTSTCQDDTCHI
ncbi:2',3'-cyclic-nucleotide 2'-phosphodiesterase [Gracilaria domingensis]|nr:2',3'-cyclic-nucleotide 2'-phosphodiesterase [Gracilaria domingensis]